MSRSLDRIRQRFYFSTSARKNAPIAACEGLGRRAIGAGNAGDDYRPLGNVEHTSATRICSLHLARASSLSGGYGERSRPFRRSSA
jgi:hypothetical protein